MKPFSKQDDLPTGFSQSAIKKAKETRSTRKSNEEIQKTDTRILKIYLIAIPEMESRDNIEEKL